MPSPVRSPKNSAARWGSNSSSRTRAAPAARLASTRWQVGADGYTLAISAVSPITLLPHLGKLPFDPVNDVAPVASVMYSPVYVLATPAFTGKSFADVLAQSKAKPGAIRVATSGIATLGHLMVESIKAKSGLGADSRALQGRWPGGDRRGRRPVRAVHHQPEPGRQRTDAEGHASRSRRRRPQRLASFPGRADAGRTRLPGSEHDQHLRHLCARQRCRPTSSTACTPRSPKPSPRPT